MILIIAYGNSLRRDDGAGFLAADALERILREKGREVERIDTHQLEPELAEKIAAEEVSAVVFADARVAGPDPDGRRIEARRLESDFSAPSVGHHLDSRVVMLYSRLLYGKDPPAWLITVPGVDFDHGEGLSETAAKAVEELPGLLASLPDGWPLEGTPAQ